MKKYVFTGGQCAGKTTTLNELARRGYYTVTEAVTLALENNIPLQDAGKLRHDLESRIPENAIAFCDRGFPDAIGFFNALGRPIPNGVIRNCQKYRYDGVFLFELLPEQEITEALKTRKIDDKQISYEFSKKLHQALLDAYVKQGYSPIRVPVMPVKERADFVLEKLELLK